MKKFLFILLTIFSPGCDNQESQLQVKSCRDNKAVLVDQLDHTPLMVNKVAEIWVLDSYGTPLRRYQACNLPESLKIQGISVTFDADIYPIPPHVKMVGTPIEITKIYLVGF